MASKSKNSSDSSSPSSAITVSVPWVEKYRPNKVDEVVYQEEVVKALKKSLESFELPHLLFYGPPGTGKTSTILAVARELFGPLFFKERVLELNASDERGINVIRTKVKQFAQTSVGYKPPGYQYPLPPYKLIILDEADSMTSDAQAALRRTMEQYSKSTRFCLICNYITKIIDPLTSRCAKFRFKPLEKNLVTERLKHICSNEGLEITEKAIETIIQISEGDLRKAITTLQSAYRMFGTKLVPRDVMEMAGVVPIGIIESYFLTACSKDFSAIQKETDNIIRSGFSATQLLSQLTDYVIGYKAKNEGDDQTSEEKKYPSLGDIQKSHICITIAETEKRLSDGSDEYIQLLNVASNIMKVANNL